MVFTFATSSFSQTEPGSQKSTSYWLTPQKMIPLSFMEAMRIKNNQVNKIPIVTMEDNFPNNWVTKKDIDTLIKLVNSREKCNCLLNPLSSYIPTKDIAELGGYAIWLIKAYREKRNVTFGLYACPKVNKVEADELILWWAIQADNKGAANIVL